jgi:hypothetical protein
MNAKFDVIKGDEATAIKAETVGRGSLTAALIRGDVLWFPGRSSNQVASKGSPAKARGYRVRTRTAKRDGVNGAYLWAESEAA